MTKNMSTEWDSTIPRISSRVLSLTRFYKDFMIPNRPLIITDMTEGWGARDWINIDGSIDLLRIQNDFGASEVTVHNCSKQIQDMGRLETLEMSVREYIDWWSNRSGTSQDENLLYLKDWNFCKEFPRYIFEQRNWLALEVRLPLSMLIPNLQLRLMGQFKFSLRAV